MILDMKSEAGVRGKKKYFKAKHKANIALLVS